MAVDHRRGDDRLGRTILAVAATAVAALLIWLLWPVLLLAFAALLLAIGLRSLADLIQRHTPAGETVSNLLAGLALILAIGGFLWLLGAQIRAQAAQLLDRIPDLIRAVEELLGVSNLEGWLVDRAEEFMSGGLLPGLAGATSLVVIGFAHVLVVIVAGAYFAARPSLYRRGLLKLFPQSRRRQAAETAEAVGGALKRWLIGQLAAMLLVGTLTTLGLWAIGVEAALALGVIAGILEFVPIVGPILAAVPAIGVALGQDMTTALLVLGLYVVIQQLEGNVITPLIQQRAVSLPPALTVLAILAFGTLFGPLGVLLATPLTVVTMVLVQKLWIRDALDEQTEIPGEEGG